jgi:hypothetical protein
VSTRGGGVELLSQRGGLVFKILFYTGTRYVMLQHVVSCQLVRCRIPSTVLEKTIWVWIDPHSKHHVCSARLLELHCICPTARLLDYEKSLSTLKTNTTSYLRRISSNLGSEEKPSHSSSGVTAPVPLNNLNTKSSINETVFIPFEAPGEESADESYVHHCFFG